jgi:hypothetical protein
MANTGSRVITVPGPNLHMVTVLYAGGARSALAQRRSTIHPVTTTGGLNGVREAFARRIRTPPEQHRPCSDAEDRQPW